MNILALPKILLAPLLIALALPSSVFALKGGNTSGGGGPEKVMEGELKLLIEGSGLKTAMINYVHTVPVIQIEDAQVREGLKKMIWNGHLEDDINGSHYVVMKECRDALDELKPAATPVGKTKSDICFDVEKLASAYKGLSQEEMMIRLAALAFHEHTHHFQKWSTESTKSNEDSANRIAGYVSITAKFVQLPLLKWTNPSDGTMDVQAIQTMWEAVKAKEQILLSPKPADYLAFPGYAGKTDRGLIRLMPRGKYEGKISTREGGSYYSFIKLNHEYGSGSDLGFEGGQLMVGFAGCDFGFIVKLDGSLESINGNHPALAFLKDFKPASHNDPELRKQHYSAGSGLVVNGFEYRNRAEAKVGQTFAIRSINFEVSDLLVVFQIIKVDEEGGLIIAWKKIMNFPVSSCR